jgi:hypothetical protein
MAGNKPPEPDRPPEPDPRLKSVIRKVHRLTATFFRVSPDSTGGTYKVGALSLMLNQIAEPSSAAITVEGLVLDNDDPDADLAGEVRLIDDSSAVRTWAMDRVGSFTLESVVPGAYQLEIHSAHQVTIFENLRIGGPGLEAHD